MKVLFFADVGLSKEGVYHVGDEAMFLAAYLWYRKNSAKDKLAAISKSISHQSLNIKEIVGLDWPNKPIIKRTHFFWLSFNVLLLALTNKSFLTPTELKVINAIRRADKVHFTGGGNITSVFAPWFYYSFFIIFCAAVFRKKIIMISQTIGPIRFIDLPLTCLLLNFVSEIDLRNELTTINPLLKYGVILPKIKTAIDSAYFLLVKKINRKKNKYIRIGLSLHTWENCEDKLSKVMRQTLNDLSKTYKIKVVIISNEFTVSGQSREIDFVTNILKGINSKIKIELPSYKKNAGNRIEPSIFVKQLISTLDLVISTRYHSLVFALSENVPVISISMVNYHVAKNIPILKLIYGNNFVRHHVYLDQKNLKTDLINKIKFILENIKKEQLYLINKNKLLKK
jgi:hypothetical protein